MRLGGARADERERHALRRDAGAVRRQQCREHAVELAEEELGGGEREGVRVDRRHRLAAHRRVEHRRAELGDERREGGGRLRRDRAAGAAAELDARADAERLEQRPCRLRREARQLRARPTTCATPAGTTATAPSSSCSGTDATVDPDELREGIGDASIPIAVSTSPRNCCA